MKRLYILIFTIFLFPSLKAQQFPITNQYLINPFSLNPSYAGIEGTINGFLGFRKDWIDVDGAPETKYLSLSGAIGKKTGMGGTIVNDRTDIFNNLYATINYTFHAKFTEDVRMGLSIIGGLNEKNIDISNSKINDNQDPLLLNINSQHGLSTFAGAAILFRAYGADIGFHAPLIWESSTYFGENSKIKYKLDNYYIGHLSYDLKLNDDWSVKPTGILRVAQNSPVNWEAALMANYKDQVWVEGIYRKNSIIGIGAGAALNERIVFNYTYEFGSNGMINASSGTHEITIGMRLGKASKKDEMIRQLQNNESSMRNAVDSLKKVTGGLETELADLKRKQAEQEASGTPAEQELKEKIADLESRINSMKTRIDTTGVVPGTPKGEVVLGRDYILVVGAFAFEDNAKKYAETCKSEGYKPALYYNPDRKMHYVYLYKYTDIKQANKKKAELRAAGFNNAWIFYQKK